MVLPCQASAQPPPSAPADSALVDVNARLPYDFFASVQSTTHGPRASGQASSAGPRMVLCYYDQHRNPRVAVYGPVAAPPSPEECHRLNPDQAGLPAPPAGWKEVANLASNVGPFLNGSLLLQTTGGRLPFDDPYVYTDASFGQLDRNRRLCA